MRSPDPAPPSTLREPRSWTQYVHERATHSVSSPNAEPSQALPHLRPRPLRHLQLLQASPYLHHDQARIVFLDTLERLRKRHQFYVFGYVLMPEHVHLLLSEPPKKSLSGIFRALKTETSKQLKGQRPRFWQLNYYDFNVFTQPKFVENSATSTATPLCAASSKIPKTGHGAAIATGSQAKPDKSKSNPTGPGHSVNVRPVHLPPERPHHGCTGTPLMNNWTRSGMRTDPKRSPRTIYFTRSQYNLYVASLRTTAPPLPSSRGISTIRSLP